MTSICDVAIEYTLGSEVIKLKITKHFHNVPDATTKDEGFVIGCHCDEVCHREWQRWGWCCPTFAPLLQYVKALAHSVCHCSDGPDV